MDTDVSSVLLDWPTPAGGVMTYNKRWLVGEHGLTSRGGTLGLNCTLAVSEAAVWYTKWSAIEVMLGLCKTSGRTGEIKEHLTKNLAFVPVYRGLPLDWSSFYAPRGAPTVPKRHWSEAEVEKWVRAYLPQELYDLCLVHGVSDLTRPASYATDVFLPI